MNYKKYNIEKTRISINLNNYTIHEIKPSDTETFYKIWKENKETFNKNGYTLFKPKFSNQYYVAYYDGTKSTEEKYLKQQKEFLDIIYHELIDHIKNNRNYWTKNEIISLKELISDTSIDTYQKLIDRIETDKNSDNKVTLDIHIIRNIEMKIFFSMLSCPITDANQMFSNQIS